MKKLALLATLLVALAGPVMAQNQVVVTGTVVSSTSDQVVIRTSSGNMTFNLAGAERPSTFTTGNHVTVWYNPTMQNNMYTVNRVEAGDADIDWDNIKVVTGTVVSYEEDDLVLKTTSGTLNFDLDKNTPHPATMVAGNRVTVWYDADDKVEDNMDARKVVMAPAISTVSTYVPPPAQTSTTTTETYTQTQTTQSYDTTTDTYPDTASPMPLLLLGSLASLGGAAAIRFARRR
jgi:hypothetical protein